MDIRKGAAVFLVMAVMLVALAGHANAAVHTTWTLSGTVYDAGTCQGIAGAYVFSPTYSAAINYTVASGNYLVRLGVGNQTIVASAAGYLNTTVQPRYEPAGSVIIYNIGMLKAGEAVAASCSFSAASTPGAVGNTTTVQQTTQPTSTTIAATTSPTSSNGSTYAIVAVVIVIIVILGVVAYVAMRPKKPAPQHHHEQK